VSKEEILREFDEKESIYKSFSLSMESLITALLLSSGIKVHSISPRVKEKESLSKKIDKKNKYTSLEEITDIVGLRIITHYSDGVDLIAGLVQKEFQVDVANSIDKRAALDPDRFGYLSLHFVVSLNTNFIRPLNLKFKFVLFYNTLGLKLSMILGIKLKRKYQIACAVNFQG